MQAVACFFLTPIIMKGLNQSQDLFILGVKLNYDYSLLCLLSHALAHYTVNTINLCTFSCELFIEHYVLLTMGFALFVVIVWADGASVLRKWTVRVCASDSMKYDSA